MDKEKIRNRHLYFAFIFFFIAVYMLFYYAFPLIAVGEHNPFMPFRFEFQRTENIILAIVVPFVVFLISIFFYNFHLMKIDYCYTHDGVWGFLTVMSIVAIALGCFILIIPPLVANMLYFSNFFIIFASIEILAVDLLVLSRIAKKRRRLLGVTPNE